MARGKSLLEVARVQEIERLVRFLDHTQGGSLLLGGDRGSGKTKLIDIAINTHDKSRFINWSCNPLPLYAQSKRLRSLTMAKIVKIHIPLIIIDKKGGDSEQDIMAKYRSMLMRAILIGLEADLSKRHWGWLDLPMRWFRSIGYVQRVYAMKDYSHYLAVNKSASKGLSVSAFGLAPAMQNAITAEVDLTDSTIEIKLRDLLTQYSKIHNFIFVFDELDKLPSDIKLESIVLYLKNLFSETGVHAIFVSSEVDLKRIVQKANNGVPPNEESTLFIDCVLLNNLRMDEFSTLVKDKVIVDQPDANMPELMSALSLRTRRSPHELNKVFIRYGDRYSKLIRGLKVELGAKRFARFGVMQLFIDHVHQVYSGRFDEYYDRFLYEALQRAGAILLESASTFVNVHDAVTLFYTSDEFTKDGISKEQALENEKAFKRDKQKNVPETTPAIVVKIKELLQGGLSDHYYTIEGAVGSLILLLNRTNCLPLRRTDSDQIFQLKPIAEHSFTHAKIQTEKLETMFDPTEGEADIFNEIRKYNAPFLSLTGQNIYGTLPMISALDHKNILNYNNIYSLANSGVAWEKLEEVATNARRKLLSALVEKIGAKTQAPIDASLVDYSSKSALITLGSGKKVRLIMLLAGQRLGKEPDVDKTFIFRGPGATRHRGKPQQAVKNFSMTNSWTSLDSNLDHVAHWIDANS